jgi:YebC/PmpR family DNA-binding regulatory protein
MSGHSKWANIKHRKAAQDAKRGKVFTRIGKEITVAAKQGGGDPETNFKLRSLIDKARAVNMPLDNIERSVKRGTGELPGVSYEEQTYEGYGPEGIAVIVDCLTDNKNRTVSALRHLFSSHNGNLGETGSVNWMFEKKGVIRTKKGTATEDDFIEQLIDFNLDDIDIDDDTVTLYVHMKQLDAAKKALQDVGHAVEAADVEWVAKNLVEIPESKEDKVIEFLEKIEDLDDVQNVYSNIK